ncbi:MAG TPA: glycoside hydrolase family 2 TIM barrel-domain containing protein, partial [Flavisolibacter sp.]
MERYCYDFPGNGVGGRRPSRRLRLPLVHQGKEMHNVFIFLCAFAVLLVHKASAQGNTRVEISLDKGWYTRASDRIQTGIDAFDQTAFAKHKWEKVDVPHNWDGYEGYRRLRHGNRHGYAYYTKTFTVPPQPKGKRFFLFFEGVSSYATVWLNKKKVGYHAGGRTTFTIDITDAVRLNHSNLLAVRADHPPSIQNLPWICGGCSDERGFSEGSQPMGIFRPVHLVITNDVRIEPFGVHVWNDSTASREQAQLSFTTEVKNYSNAVRKVTVVSRLLDKKGTVVSETNSIRSVPSGTITVIKQQSPPLRNVTLWSLEDPYLYTLVTEIKENGKVVDRITTPYGIRTIQWPIGRNNTNQFFLNGKPVFINGIAEYEHLLGNSHAFSAEQIRSRVLQMKTAGFNAFREAHQPHNLRYQKHWDSLGFLLWT